jgi:lysophospholipase L1-like esterase
MGVVMKSKIVAYTLVAAALIAQTGFAQGLGGAAPPLSPALLQCADLSSALVTVANQDTRLRDWANLARYRDANKSVARTDVVFMGDSITDFWQQPRFGGFFPEKNYVDRGISAQTTSQMLLRMRPDVIALKPKAVVILAGTNDIAGNTGPMTDEDIEGNLASMAELAAANGIKVVFSSITPVSAYHVANGTVPQTTRRPVARVQKINDWMRSYAASHKHVYLDYYSKMIDNTGMLKTEFSADDLHPTAEGYAAMAPLAEAAITQALK